MNVPSEVRTPASPSVNGDLVNRVQQLRLNDQLGGTARRAGGSWLPWVLCALLALTWAGVGARWYKTANKDRDDETVAAPGSPTTASRPSGSNSQGTPTAPGEIMFTLKGNLIPSLQIAVSPDDVGARVTRITFWEGKLVKEGDLLAELVDSQYANKFKSDEAAVASAAARVGKAKAGVASAAAGLEKAKADITNWEAQIVLAKAELKRATQAAAVSATAQTDLDKAKSTLDVNQAQLAAARATRTSAETQEVAAAAELTAAEAELNAAQARRDESKRLLDSCKILAPITGTVLTKKADRGSLVNPLAFASTSGSLCEIADLSKMEVEIDVPERQITKVREKLDCLIAADANPDRPYRGYVDRIMPIADDSKNVIKVRVRVILPKGELPGSFLKPKMSVTVTAYNREFAYQPADQPWE